MSFRYEHKPYAVYEVKMYADISRAARALEQIVLELEALNKQLYTLASNVPKPKT